jgi:hypothetical protein
MIKKLINFLLSLLRGEEDFYFNEPLYTQRGEWVIHDEY